MTQSGLKLTRTHSTLISHHLTSTLHIAAPLLTSMLNAAQLVRPDWLTEYLRVGDVEKDVGVPAGSSDRILTMLEFEFLPPSETKFRPPFAPSLPSSTPTLKTFKTWEANEERVGLLRAWRVLFVCSASTRENEVELREMISAAGAEYEVFDVDGEHGDGGLESRWKQVLGRSRRRAGAGAAKGTARGMAVVVVPDVQTVAAAAGDEYWEMIRTTLKESVS